MAKKIRNKSGNQIHDTATVVTMQYNEKSGAEKNVDVGPKLLPIQNGSSKTCDASTALSVPAGKNFAIYNNSAVLGVVAFGDAAAELASMPAAGAVLANGQAGIPCMPNQWTYVSAGEQTFIRTSAATMLVFLIDDDTAIVPSGR